MDKIAVIDPILGISCMIIHGIGIGIGTRVQSHWENTKVSLTVELQNIGADV